MADLTEKQKQTLRELLPHLSISALSENGKNVTTYHFTEAEVATLSSGALNKLAQAIDCDPLNVGYKAKNDLNKFSELSNKVNALFSTYDFDKERPKCPPSEDIEQMLGVLSSTPPPKRPAAPSR